MSTNIFFPRNKEPRPKKLVTFQKICSIFRLKLIGGIYKTSCETYRSTPVFLLLESITRHLPYFACIVHKWHASYAILCLHCVSVTRHLDKFLNLVEEIDIFLWGQRGEILLFFQKPILAHFSITFLSVIQVLVWYKNLSYFFAEYHRLETPL